jgi:hypothetical protein
MKLLFKVVGVIKKNTIYLMKFSANGSEQNKCTCSNTYLKDAEKFASQFKKSKEVEVLIEIISEHGTAYGL